MPPTTSSRTGSPRPPRRFDSPFPRGAPAYKLRASAQGLRGIAMQSKVATLMASFVVIALDIATLVSAASEAEGRHRAHHGEGGGAAHHRQGGGRGAGRVIRPATSSRSPTWVYDFRTRRGGSRGVCIRIDRRGQLGVPGSRSCRTAPSPSKVRSTTTATRRWRSPGGRATYRNARGTMEIRARHGGEQYAFVFNILP
jgi:hypothetical protein